ncbi:MAG: AAA family ATPase, partial [Candidatus Poribacteria bacterium]|nr:AAA family ATPase [Candidatus Poribacteria bacterium]
MPNAARNTPVGAQFKRELLQHISEIGLVLDDVVGGTRPVSLLHLTLNEEDLTEDDVSEFTSELFRVIKEHNGRIDRFLQGTGILIVFGLPNVLEDDPIHAVEAAFVIQNIDSCVRTKVAADSGKAYIAQTTWGEFAICGMVVRDTERLSEHADWDEVVAGTSMHTELSARFELTPIQSPPVAYRVTHQPSFEHHVSALDLIGRSHELSQLVETFEWVNNNGQGGSASLMGGGGVGKSRLVTEFKTLAQSTENLLYLEVRAGEHGVLYPLITRLLGSPTSEEEVTQSLQRLGFTEDQIHPAKAALVELMVNHKGSGDNRWTMQSWQEAMYHGTRIFETVFVPLISRRPTLVILEDLHLSFDVSIDLLTHLLLSDQAMEAGKLFVVMTSRPEGKVGERCVALLQRLTAKWQRRHVAFHLQPLLREENDQLIADVLQGKVDPRVTDVVWEKCRGIPFYTKELVRSLRDSDRICLDDDQWSFAADPVPADVPESLQRIVLARYHALNTEERLILKHAAVIGRTFSVQLLRQMLAGVRDDPGEELTDIINDLERRRYINLDNLLDQTYSFHDIHWEALYTSIPEHESARLHERIAEALEEDVNSGKRSIEVARHYLRSHNDRKAVEYQIKAGEETYWIAPGTMEIQFFTNALERLERMDLRTYPSWRWFAIRARKGLGRAYFAIGDIAAAEEAFREGINLVNEMRLSDERRGRNLVPFYYWLGQVLAWQNRYDEVVEISEAGIALVEDEQSVECALMNLLLAQGYLNAKGDTQAYHKLMFRVEENLEHLPYSPDLRNAYTTISWMRASHFNDMKKAWHIIDRLHHHAEKEHDLKALAEVLLHKGYLLICQGNLTDALYRLTEARRKFEEMGNTQQNWCLLRLGQTMLALGKFDQAAEYLSLTVDASKANGSKIHEAFASEDLATISFTLGDYDECEAHLDNAIKCHDNTPRTPVKPLMLKGLLHLARGSGEMAIQVFRQALDMLVQQQHNPLPAYFAGTVATVLNGLEAAGMDTEAFHSLCAKLTGDRA